MAKRFNLQTGKIGEQIARTYLEKQGYKILEQNFKTEYAEIDLITRKKNEIILVEVRTKRGELFGTPEDSLNKRKLRKLHWNANAYVSGIRWSGHYRVDAVCIVLGQDNSAQRINHYKNVV